MGSERVWLGVGRGEGKGVLDWGCGTFASGKGLGYTGFRGMEGGSF